LNTVSTPSIRPPRTTSSSRDIVAYVRESAETPSPGGYGLGGYGPAPEGMAAWIIGMVAVIAAALWIGARA
jgi:ubiquinol-cytochrome c reductase cytochrome c subunit